MEFCKKKKKNGKRTNKHKRKDKINRKRYLPEKLKKYAQNLNLTMTAQMTS